MGRLGEPGPLGVSIRLQMPRTGMILSLYAGMRPAVYALVEKMTLRAAMEPRGVETIQQPEASGSDETEVTGVVVCRLVPRSRARPRRCVTSLYGQMWAAVDEKAHFPPLTPVI